MQITLDSTKLILFLDRVIHDLDISEGRLRTIDMARNPAFAPNDDVIDQVIETNLQARKLREGLGILELNPGFFTTPNLSKRENLMQALLASVGISTNDDANPS